MAGSGIVPPVKVGIVVPFSWSFWGAVVEHAELQAAALEALGCDVRLIMGNDPPGSSRGFCTRGSAVTATRRRT